MICYWRFVFAWMGFSGLVLVYMLRVNISVAIVAMVHNDLIKPKNLTPECPLTVVNVSQNKNSGNFYWSENDQTMILSSFYWGYTIMQIPSGFLLLLYNAKWIYGLSTLTASILTFFIPLAANSGVYTMVVLRFLMGICEGPTYPGLYTLCGCWILKNENSIIIALIGSGSSIGTIIGQSFSGFIIQKFGWQYLFYFMATFGTVWFFMYIVLVFDKPHNHPFISDQEKQLLITSLPHNNPKYMPKSLIIPWKKVFTSKPFVGFILFASAFNFTWYIMINCLPIYIGRVLGFDIAQNGGISSIPYIALLMFSIIGGAFQDYLKSKNIISLTKIRKFFGCTGMIVSSFIMFCVTLTGCNITLTIALVCLSISMLGFSGTVTAVNILDIAPAYAGPLVSISNICNSICGIVAPYIKELFTKHGETRNNWGNVFITTSSILFLGSFIYLLFGSATLQPWAILDIENEKLISYENSDYRNKIKDNETNEIN